MGQIGSQGKGKIGKQKIEMGKRFGVKNRWRPGQPPVSYLFPFSPTMKLLAICSLAFSAASAGWAAAGPSGEYVEVHSCEVYTGGCTASAQATQGGRQAVRVWRMEAGNVGEVDLSGLTVAVAEVGNENLAANRSAATQVQVYLPEDATEAQRGALRSWLNGQGISTEAVRLAPITYQRERDRIVLAVGDAIQLSTRALAACDAGGCGEQLWYEPRARLETFTVLVNAGSAVNEPRLNLVWKDHSTKSVFFGRFGDGVRGGFQLAGLP